MKCQQCGHENERVIMQPLIPPVQPTPEAVPVTPEKSIAYARWACERCGRYHFRDGTLYENPFRKGQKP